MVRFHSLDANGTIVMNVGSTTNATAINVTDDERSDDDDNSDQRALLEIHRAVFGASTESLRPRSPPAIQLIDLQEGYNAIAMRESQYFTQLNDDNSSNSYLSPGDPPPTFAYHLDSASSTSHESLSSDEDPSPRSMPTFFMPRRPGKRRLRDLTPDDIVNALL